MQISRTGLVVGLGVVLCVAASAPAQQIVLSPSLTVPTQTAFTVDVAMGPAGLPVMGETCPQYLFFNEHYLERDDGSKWVCSPPMRTGRTGLPMPLGSVANRSGTDH